MPKYNVKFAVQLEDGTVMREEKWHVVDSKGKPIAVLQARKMVIIEDEE